MDDHPTVRVVLADDSDDMRLMLRLLLQACGRFTVVGEARDGDAALELVTRERPDLLLLDLVMPGCDGLTTLDRLAPLVDGDRPRVVVHSSRSAWDCAPDVIDRGAARYVQKGADTARLPEILWSCHQQAVAAAG